MNKALIIIDYSYDFVADDGKLTAGKPAQAIEDNIETRIKEFIAAGDVVVFAMDYHNSVDPGHPESKLFPPHNIVGTKGREIYGKIKDTYEQIKDLENVYWLDKRRYSSFYGTPLDSILRGLDIKQVVLAGVCTDICVLHTAVDAYNLGYQIQVPRDCVATFNPDAHEVALNHFKNSLGADLL